MDLSTLLHGLTECGLVDVVAYGSRMVTFTVHGKIRRITTQEGGFYLVEEFAPKQRYQRNGSYFPIYRGSYESASKAAVIGVVELDKEAADKIGPRLTSVIEYADRTVEAFDDVGNAYRINHEFDSIKCELKNWLAFNCTGKRWGRQEGKNQIKVYFGRKV